jgi:uncharacterized membrane protein
MTPIPHAGGRRYIAPAPPPADDQTTSFLALTVAALGGALLIGASPRGLRGSLMRVTGATLLGVAARPLAVEQIRKAGARRRSLTAHTRLEIQRPVRDVFAFFKDFESFPRVMGSLRSVVDYQDGLSHWEMYTPSGGVVAWDVVVTKYVPNSVIGWESVPASDVEMRGLVRFMPVGASVTHVELEMTYHPVRTALNDALFALIRRQSHDRLYAALERARYYVESLPAPLAEADEPAP